MLCRFGHNSPELDGKTPIDVAKLNNPARGTEAARD
ncbi:ankyrin repeat-containing protein 2 [Actinidia rufa]|uniref:Ankyrin repeat-containing protein 2 n=1 Tax=Actinidia rufa TaxID=165716 RepID=A0A7J0ETI1_9ERIC|nr:ankyrin repeat-containing protein 2 [Actinidia rufa]